MEHVNRVFFIRDLDAALVLVVGYADHRFGDRSFELTQIDVDLNLRLLIGP